MYRKETGLEKLFEAITSGAQIYQINFSMLNPSYCDIPFKIPSLRAADTIFHFSKLNKKSMDQIMLETVQRFVLIDEVLDWLLEIAPAGLLSSTYKAIMMTSRFKDSPTFNEHLAFSRGQSTLVTSYSDILYGDFKLDPNTINSLNKDDFAKLIASIEKWYKTRTEILDGKDLATKGEPWIDEDDYRLKDHSSLRGVDLPKVRIGSYNANVMESLKHRKIQEIKPIKGIDFDKENRAFDELASLGLPIYDYIDPYTTNFETESVINPDKRRKKRK